MTIIAIVRSQQECIHNRDLVSLAHHRTSSAHPPRHADHESQALGQYPPGLVLQPDDGDDRVVSSQAQKTPLVRKEG